MSFPWGPALDAEITYRHERAQLDLQRRRTSRREPARHVPAERTAAVPTIPIQPHPLSRVVIPAQCEERAEAGPGRDRADVHAA